MENQLAYTDGHTHYDNLTAEICPVHVAFDLRRDRVDYVSLSDGIQGGAWPSASRCFECPKCEMNFQIHIDRLAHQPESLFVWVTRWYNLGQGKSPQEAEWSRHLEHDREEQYCYNLGCSGVRQTFEETPGLSQTELLDRNAHILVSGEYKNWIGKFESWSQPISYYPGNYPQTSRR